MLNCKKQHENYSEIYRENHKKLFTNMLKYGIFNKLSLAVAQCKDTPTYT